MLFLLPGNRDPKRRLQLATIWQIKFISRQLGNDSKVDFLGFNGPSANATMRLTEFSPVGKKLNFAPALPNASDFQSI